MNPAKKDERKRYNLRFEDGMREELTRMAKANDRKLSEEIIHLLKIAMGLKR